ncbi:hypothetical protein HNQ58_000263 [Rehaibacterium terrae]|uniref:Uncharacterized protein n=1 Tax=Rehaibacterium terrae TaxID=1341696 RepID=A0A7W7XYD6_9GAMM|nr:hypothetical protein [Rehaibacterium terrae]
MRWKVFEGAMHVDLLIDFFKRLVKDSDRKVFLLQKSPDRVRRYFMHEPLRYAA